MDVPVDSGSADVGDGEEGASDRSMRPTTCEAGSRIVPDIVDFCDMAQFEGIMKDWATATGLATLAVGDDGRYISDCYNFTEFCYGLTRKSPEGLRRCIECDKKGSGIYLCHAGLVDFASPITLDDGTVLGSILGGQVLPEQPDEERFRATARELGIDEDAYIEALRKVSVRSREQTEASLNLLANVINQFVRASYAAHIDAETLTERARIISSLSKIYFCDYYIDLESDRFIELDATPKMHEFIGNRGSAAELVPAAIRHFAEQEYQSDFLAFADLSTLAERLVGRQSISFEVPIIGIGWCRAIFIAVDRDEAGLPSHVIYAIQDIQEEKQRELEVRRTLEESAIEARQASLAKTDFLSRMSHDMRTPLNGIIGMTYLTEEMELPTEARRNLEKIDVSSKFLLSLINDILDMSKMESGNIELHLEPYPFGEFKAYLDAVIRPLCDEKKQHFTLEMGDRQTRFVPLVDKLRVSQIVFNILSNAVKFTPVGGSIVYRIDEQMLPDGRIALDHKISDTGCGMSPGFLKDLFEPFAQENRNDISEQRGSGLGLAIVKRLVDAMGGTIEVESEVGKGTTFRIHYELETITAEEAQEEGGVHPDSAPDDLGDLAGKRVLLCEDHPMNQEIAKALLVAEKMVVDVAENGADGLRAFERSADGHYDYILMDVRMPVMDGIETTRAIRALDRPDAKTVPIIAMTADAFEDDVERCLDAGMVDHLAKPVEPQRLYSAMLRHERPDR